jgi:glycosyltransferase involved in cell wall biosynthesis
MGDHGRRSLIEDYGTDPERISVVHGGLNYRELPEPGTLSPEPMLLFVGREIDRKGGDVLLDAFRRVRTHIPSASLHIVGAKVETDLPGVVVHGKIANRQELGKLYRSARAFCLPSHYEPWGLVLVEAMAHGTPCIGSRVQAIPDILDNGRAGLLVEPGNADDLADAAIALLTDDDLATKLGSAGRVRVERQFTWERVVERMAPALARAGDFSL